MSSTVPTYTLAEGCPMGSASTAQRFGDDTPVKGLMLLQDTQLIETLAHFSRERIPERMVHASAVGAWGEFEATHDNSDITDAAFLQKGTKSEVLWRLSMTGPRAGHSETCRDVRGWAMKIKTTEGNQDFVFNDIPVFFIRDPIKFPSLNRSHQNHPRMNHPDPNMFWDFHCNNQESIHALMILFSNRGIPANVRQLNGYSGHTYKFTKADGTFVYAKIHFRSDEGAVGMKLEEATKLMGTDPAHYTSDMYEHIEAGKFPTWTMSAQIMTEEQAENYRWNIFDMTRVWPHADFPLRPMGKLTLNRNPENYFSDIEQAAFSPSTMVPGIAPTLDPVFQARMFAYPDASRYRLGANYQQLPCNKANSPVYSPYQRDGAMRYMTNYGGDPSYVGSQLKKVNFKGPLGTNGYSTGRWNKTLAGIVAAYESEVTDEDFVQARAMWGVLLKAGEHDDFITNVVASLGGAMPVLQAEAVKMFARVDKDLGADIEKVLKSNKK